MLSELTVIIPMYNAEKFISETIKSLFDQTYKDFKVILLDDCSDDNSIEIAKQIINSDTRFEIIKNDKNLGYLKSTNILIWYHL